MNSNQSRTGSGWMTPLTGVYLLALGTVIYRSGAAEWQTLADFSPMVALGLVASVYLPKYWGWLVTPAVYFSTEFLFLSWNKVSDGYEFSYWMLLGPVFYALLGLVFAAVSGRNRSLWSFVGASFAASVSFYLISNTASWWSSPSYSQDFAGWVQANTVGIAGYPPSWTFLRNAVVGDQIFTLGALAFVDSALVARSLGKLYPKAATAPAWVN